MENHSISIKVKSGKSIENSKRFYGRYANAVLSQYKLKIKNTDSMYVYLKNLKGIVL